MIRKFDPEIFMEAAFMERTKFWSYVRILRKANGLKGKYKKPLLIGDL